MQNKDVGDAKKNTQKQKTTTDHAEYIQVNEEETCIDVVEGITSMTKDVNIANMKVKKMMKFQINMRKKNYLK